MLGNYGTLSSRTIGYFCKHKPVLNILQRVYYGLFSYPKTLVVHLGSQCNYDCIYCYSDRDPKERGVSTERWIEIIGDAAEMGVTNIAFTGGEPFLHPDFYPILKFSAEKVSSISMYTNGSLITDEWIRRIKSLEAKIRIAIKFDSPLTYSIHTQASVPFGKIEENIRKCVRNDLPVIAFITLTKYNSGYIGDIIKSALDLGAYPDIERYNPVKDSRDNERLEIGEEDWGMALKLYRETYSDISDVYEKLKFPHRGLCECYRNVISITSDGYVLPCSFLPVEVHVGNIKEKSLAEIWLKYEKRRKEWFKIPEECKECEDAYLCGGGCKTHSYLKYGNMNKKDPLCTGEIPPTYCRIGGLGISRKKFEL